MNQQDIWAQITLPPKSDMLEPAQRMVRCMAEKAGFDKHRLYAIELATEEVFHTILRYAYADGESGDGELQIRIKTAQPLFRVDIVNTGMPFDLSLVPGYKPDDARAGNEQELEAGLSLFLLKHSVDRYRIVNEGAKGLRFEMEWFLPADNIADMPEQPDESNVPDKADMPDAHTEPVSFRLLADKDAIKLAQLVYRCYGYSYAYEDIYYPERIQANYREGLLKSWGAVTDSGRLAGHLALMKNDLGDKAVEWGVAVVDPDWRGAGLMKKMLAIAVEDVQHRDESVLFAHAVTAHPYTQKTCNRFGFKTAALLLCYAPATMQFRNISEHLKQRESTFLAMRCMRPLPREQLYFPVWHAATLDRLFTELGVSLDTVERTDSGRVSEQKTEIASCTIRSVNAGNMNVYKTGADYAEVIAMEHRRLCRERVDVVYLTIDLADPGAPAIARAAEGMGFFLAGFTPMLRRPHSLTFQYLNNLAVDYGAIHTDGELAGWLKDTVASEQRRVEKI